MLREFLREMCEKQLYFSFYLKYPENWLREVQLYDKTMIEYQRKILEAKWQFPTRYGKAKVII